MTPTVHYLRLKEASYTDRTTGKAVRFPVPFNFKEVMVESQTGHSTKITLLLNNLNGAALSKMGEAVYSIEVHTRSLVIIYTHNFTQTGFLRVRGVGQDDQVFIIRRRDARLICKGEIDFDYKNNMINIEVPINISKNDVKAVYLHYVPSIEAAKRSGTRPPRVSYIFYQWGSFDNRLPGWLYWTRK